MKPGRNATPEDVPRGRPAPEDAGEALVTPADTFITVELIQRAQQGDPRALEKVMERYLPRLQRWASGRLPVSARLMFDTSDLVQETLLRTIQGLDRLHVDRPGKFQAYIRQAVLNRMRDQIRFAARRPQGSELMADLQSPATSPLENAIGLDLLSKYERGMAQLEEDDRNLLHLRIELEFDYDEIAAMTGRPSRDAARMAIQRAVARLAEAMGRER